MKKIIFIVLLIFSSNSMADTNFDSLKKQKKTVSEQSQDELEPIISMPINSPMSDE